MEVGLGVAMAADPDFVPPYRLMAQIKAAAAGPRRRRRRASNRALARGNVVPEMDRARLEFELAELSGNADARQAALTKLVKLDSGDAATVACVGRSP